MAAVEIGPADKGLRLPLAGRGIIGRFHWFFLFFSCHNVHSGTGFFGYFLECHSQIMNDNVSIRVKGGKIGFRCAERNSENSRHFPASRANRTRKKKRSQKKPQRGKGHALARFVFPNGVSRRHSPFGGTREDGFLGTACKCCCRSAIKVGARLRIPLSLSVRPLASSAEISPCP